MLNGTAHQDFAPIEAPGAFAGLVAAVSQLDLTGSEAPVRELLEAASIDETALAPFVYFIPRRYTRTCVYRDERFELLVLCWSPGSQSAVHDHGRSRCFFKLLRGSLNVENYSLVENCPTVESGNEPGAARLTRGQSRILHAGDIDVRHSGRDVHRVGAGTRAAISLHLYAKPLDECLVFDLARHSWSTARNRYDIPPPR